MLSTEHLLRYANVKSFLLNICHPSDTDEGILWSLPSPSEILAGGFMHTPPKMVNYLTIRETGRPVVSIEQRDCVFYSKQLFHFYQFLDQTLSKLWNDKKAKTLLEKLTAFLMLEAHPIVHSTLSKIIGQRQLFGQGNCSRSRTDGRKKGNCSSILGPRFVWPS